MDEPLGQPFSRVYREPGPLKRDSRRLRTRIFAFVAELPADSWSEMARALQLHGGISLSGQADYWKLKKFVEEGEVDDLLDAVTYFYNALKIERLNGESPRLNRPGFRGGCLV